MRAHADRLRERLRRLLPEVQPPTSPDVHPQIGRLLAEARAAFSQGFQEALGAPPDALPRLLLDMPYQRRGFALEGAAMAVVLVDELSGDPRRLLGALLAGRSVAEQVLGAVGVGWASARLGRSSAWLPPELDPRYMHAVTDGYGFHQGFFHSDRFMGRGFPRGKGELSAPYDIGLGRALWFVHLGCVDPIARAIDNMLADRRMHLWRGVGTACAFTRSSEHGVALVGDAAKFETHFRVGLETGTQLLRALARPTEENALWTEGIS